MIAKARSYFHNITDQYGFHFSLTLVSIFGIIKGMMYQIVLNASLPYFKTAGITGSRYQSLTVVATTPWAMKSGLGLLSDTIPFMGYHKRSYIVFVSITGTIGLTCLWLFPMTPALAPVAAFLLFLVNLQVATVDLLGEAKYAEMMVANGHDGTDIVSFVWGLHSIGSVIGSFISGPLADWYDARILFAAAAPLAMQVALPALTGWFPDKKVTPFRVRKDKIRAHPGLSSLSLSMIVGASVIGVTSALGSVKQQAYTSAIIPLVLIFLGSLCLPATLRSANLFLFLNNALYLSMSGALDYFFTADELCVPDGPHFSMTYFVTWANIVGGVASLIGVTLFQRVLQGKTFQMAFCAGITVRILASLFDIAITKRININVFGINDHIFFMLGDAIITQLVAMLDLIPAVVLTSKVCPPGMEAVVFALLVSYQNLGAGVATTLGVGLTEALGIKTTVPCNFDNLPSAITIGHIILPALSFPLIFLLIPNAKLSDDIIPPDHERDLRQEHMDRARLVEYEEEAAGSGYLSTAGQCEPQQSDVDNYHVTADDKKQSTAQKEQRLHDTNYENEHKVVNECVDDERNRCSSTARKYHAEGCDGAKQNYGSNHDSWPPKPNVHAREDELGNEPRRSSSSESNRLLS